MPGVNKVILIGNLGKDPEIRRLENGVVVASFTIATSENYVDRNSGERKEITDWHDIVMWRGLAEVAEKYLKKGMKVFVEGKLKKKNWQEENRVIVSDVINYYAYLPATFIYKDLGVKKKETIESGHFWTKRMPNGNNIIKMSMGMAFVYSPFFFAGHAAAHLTGAETLGYSAPYKLALIIGALLYFLIGLIFLRKILLKYFTDTISAITILAIALGTNLAFYVGVESTMTHIYNFAFFNIFIRLPVKIK